jgi:hypothetical protein
MIPFACGYLVGVFTVLAAAILILALSSYLRFK